MFLFRPAEASHEIINETFTTASAGGAKLTFSRFDGYSPLLSGSIRTVLAENLGEIRIHVLVMATSESRMWRKRKDAVHD